MRRPSGCSGTGGTSWPASRRTSWSRTPPRRGIPRTGPRIWLTRGPGRWARGWSWPAAVAMAARSRWRSPCPPSTAAKASWCRPRCATSPSDWNCRPNASGSRPRPSGTGWSASCSSRSGWKAWASWPAGSSSTGRSSRSSPPRPRVTERAWAWPPCTGSSPRPAVTCRSTQNPASAPPSPSCCPRPASRSRGHRRRRRQPRPTPARQPFTEASLLAKLRETLSVRVSSGRL
jgi:hypothetical protein